MSTAGEQHVVDEHGNRVAVILPCRSTNNCRKIFTTLLL